MILDISRSMAFGSLPYTKHDYARTIAASISWLLNRQGDAVGLTLFDERLRVTVPARYRPGQLRRLMVTLEEKPTGKETNPGEALEHAARRLNRRGLVVLISDLLTDPTAFREGLKLLRGCGHEVVVFQILDPAELRFSFEGPKLFEDLETGQMIHCDPEVVRDSYLQKIADHNRQIREACDCGRIAD